MRIHLYSLAWNEELMMPFFLRHYSRFCEKIVIYDNESTDRTPQIVRACAQAEVRTWSSNNQLNDQLHLDIKNSAYKESRGKADWVIVCDTDEFLYHPKLLSQLESYQKKGVNFPKVKGFEMLPARIPSPEEDLPQKYKRGVAFRNLNKRVIFSPRLDMEYGPGAHSAVLPVGAKESWFSSLKLLHYKMLTLEYFIQRHETLGKRMSELNLEKGWGVHYTWSQEKMTETYNGFLAKGKVVL